MYIVAPGKVQKDDKQRTADKPQRELAEPGAAGERLDRQGTRCNERALGSYFLLDYVAAT